jgi:hypothetical protein
MGAWLDNFLRDFHRNHLKNLGFKKVRRTFSRDKGEYWERFNFQGSFSNNSESTIWYYYINVGVEFKYLEPRKYWSYFPNTHWASRIESVVADASSVGEYTEQTEKILLEKQLLNHFLTASEKMADEIDGLRDHYLKNKHLETYQFND